MSLWNYSFIQNTNEIISGFLPWIFLQLPGGFLEASWKLFELPGDLVSNIINKEAEAPKSFQEAPRKVKKISGQKSRNNFIGILDETIIS